MTRLALLITRAVGTMWCAAAFTVLALLGLPAALRPGGEGIVAWIAQTFLQLVLLSIIMVGQKLAATASESRAAETHDTVLAIRDELVLRHDQLHAAVRNLQRDPGS